MKGYLEFPIIYTFKMVGDSDSLFESGVTEIFSGHTDLAIVSNTSSGGKYISISATMEVKNYEELEAIYEKISRMEGLKFHV